MASLALVFCISSQHSNPQELEPSGRYQVLAGLLTPTEEWASGDAAPGPVQYMVRSTAMGRFCGHSTFVEKSVSKPSISSGLMVVWLAAGSAMS